MVQRYKLDEQAGLTDAQHAFVVMEAFCRQDGGNSAQVLMNSDTNIARMATFQARMKHLFKAFPEIANNPDWAKIKVGQDGPREGRSAGGVARRTPTSVSMACHYLVEEAGRAAGAIGEKGGEKACAMLELLGGDATHALYRTFTANWDNNQDEWVLYRRGNSPHLTNNTNNRIENKRGQIKDIINDTSTPKTVSRRMSSDWQSTFARLRRSRTDTAGSPTELDLVAKQHELATSPDADCAVEHSICGMETVTSPRSGIAHEVNTRARALSGAAMYTEAKVTAEKIANGMALQSTSTFRVALKWLQDFYAVLNSGEVIDFVEREVPPFHGLSQVASVGEARLSQLSFADMSSELSTNANIEVASNGGGSAAQLKAEDKGSAVVFSPKTGSSEADSTGVACEETGDYGSAQDDTGPTQISTEPGVSSAESVKTVTWAFAERPVISGITKAQRKRAQAKQDREEVLQLAAKYRQGKCRSSSLSMTSLYYWPPPMHAIPQGGHAFGEFYKLVRWRSGDFCKSGKSAVFLQIATFWGLSNEGYFKSGPFRKKERFRQKQHRVTQTVNDANPSTTSDAGR
ncbi:hypothetical protein ON010_g13962 [Phytophthora cinnamomi]|nr:hypothetical protein ON010_g13962 [Phytophthora cinnamomi]